MKEKERIRKVQIRMSDRLIRGIAGNSQIRFFIADTRELVERAHQLHDTYPVASAALGRTLTAGVIMGAMQKGEDELITIQLKGDGPLGGVTVTANAKGQVKGYVQNPYADLPPKPNGKIDVSGGIGQGTLTVIKDIGLKEPYVGTIPLESGEIAEDITYYFMTSEQIPSSVGLGVLVAPDLSICQAGGFTIQLMPFATEEVISRLEANLAKVNSVTGLFRQGMQLEQIMETLLEGLEPQITKESEPEFLCNCSRQKVSKVLVSLPKSDLKEMIDDQKPVQVHCDFCNQNYEFSVEELTRLYEGETE